MKLYNKKPMTESVYYVLSLIEQGITDWMDLVNYIEQDTQGRISMGPGTLYTIINDLIEFRWIKRCYGADGMYAISKKGVEARNNEKKWSISIDLSSFKSREKVDDKKKTSVLKYDDDENDQIQKKIYRLPACPYDDIECMESWLSDMADRGFLLCKGGFFGGLVAFYKAAPCKIRYRLIVSAQRKGIFMDAYPDEEVIENFRAFGWEYVDSRGNFNIFRTDQLDARELHTDQLIEASTISTAKLRESLSASNFFIWAILFFPLSKRNDLLLEIINFGSWITLFTFALFVWQYILIRLRTIRLKRLSKKLMGNGTIEHQVDWKKKAKWYTTRRITKTMLTVVCSICFLSCLVRQFDTKKDMFSNEYNGKIPFATMASFTTEDLESSMGEQNKTAREKLSIIEEEVYLPLEQEKTIDIKSDLLAPVIIEWNESGTYILPDEKVFQGRLHVRYYETRFPWIAKVLLRELKRCNSQHEHIYYEYYLFPEQDIDFVTAYEFGDANILMRKGNVAIYVELSQYSTENYLSLKEIATVIANHLE